MHYKKNAVKNTKKLVNTVKIVRYVKDKLDIWFPSERRIICAENGVISARVIEISNFKTP
ncbi:MAG: hypothetical protein IPK14_21125 [Blastocatellia bacterium]|nr:hypothetical protein [Blastocatellia bacterium]